MAKSFSNSKIGDRLTFHQAKVFNGPGFIELKGNKGFTPCLGTVNLAGSGPNGLNFEPLK